MRGLIHLGLKIYCQLITLLIKFPFFLKWYNKKYESSSQKWVNIFHMYVEMPKKDLVWNIVLRNKKVVRAEVDKNNYKTLQFTIDYKWYSPGMSIIENALNEFYPKDYCFVDIGANLGMRSLTALSTGRETFMFEPNNEVSDLNEQNCKLNNFKNYTIERKGVSDVAQTKEFFIDKTSYMSTMHKDESSHEFVDKIQIETVTVDEYFSQKKLAGLFIKIDVEGHEKFVLQGANNIINVYSPSLMVEINGKGDNFSAIYNLLSAKGYTVYALYSSGFDFKLLKVINSQNDEEVINSTCDFLFVKEEGVIKALAKFIF